MGEKVYREMIAFQTTHKLGFEAADSPYDIFGDGHKMFRIGTCEGQWGSTDDSYFIISVINSEPGNGHLDDVFEWFEYSCLRDGKNLLVLACFNNGFYRHLLSKRGFKPLDKKEDNCIKIFNERSYRKLLKKGNTILKAGSLVCY